MNWRLVPVHKDKSIIRFTGCGVAAGDASGGSMESTIAWPNTIEDFMGGRWYWQARHLSFYATGVGGAVGCYCKWDTGELFRYGIDTCIWTGHFTLDQWGTYGYLGANYPLTIPDFPFKPSPGAGIGSFNTLITNTNGLVVYTFVAGLIFLEDDMALLKFTKF
jgi:hypothetical protein